MADKLDLLGRPAIGDEAKQRIADAVRGVDGRGALILMGDTQSKTVRAHLAAKYDHGWKVAAGAGWQWTERQPFAEITIIKTW